LYGDKSFAEEQKKLVSSDGSSLVDVVITTPGRLVDHLQGTDKFTLIHLRFLVADEADRLLTQSYQDWLPKVLSSVHTTGRANAGHVDLVSAEEAAVPQFRIQVGSSRDTALLSAKNDTLQFPPVCACDLQCMRLGATDKNVSLQLQKLLFSATLTQNPKKLASLKLVSPTYFTAVQTAGHVFRIPTKLEVRVHASYLPVSRLHILPPA
jgi:ATP-dependent RNA helicase DDX51/DBP6